MGKQPERMDMTHWFNPGELLAMAVRVGASTVFGEMFDKRETMAALSPFDERDFSATHDYSREGFAPDGLWFDYLADTGDGWRSTYAVARLVSEPQLLVNGLDGAIPRGRLLFFGGDQVYPTASTEAYQKRFTAPFDKAREEVDARAPASGSVAAGGGKAVPEFCYAIPGNHDWYDGLTAFTRLFCARRPKTEHTHGNKGFRIGEREAVQARSYFAAKLPGNWWICGVDAQLHSFVDNEQLAYFDHIAQTMMSPGSDVIVCVPGPVWNEAADDDVRRQFDKLGYVLGIITGNIHGRRFSDDHRRERAHHLRLVLTGDSHHYTRYFEAGTPGAARGAADHGTHYITCGLGGAFLHPTHFTPEVQEFEVRSRAIKPARAERIGSGKPDRFLRRLTREAVYPTPEQCRERMGDNLGFGFKNWDFALLTAALAGVFTWLLAFAASSLGRSLAAVLRQSDAKLTFVSLLFASPWPLLMSGAVIGALIGFSGFKGRMRTVTGVGHGLAHVLVYFAVLWVLAQAVAVDWGLVIAMAIAGFLVHPLIMGLYLIVSARYSGAHWNEVFSALRIEDFKGFLRLHIDTTGDPRGRLTLYPICLDQIPRTDTDALAPRLIEAPLVLEPTPAKPQRPTAATAHSEAGPVAAEPAGDPGGDAPKKPRARKKAAG